MGTTTSTSVSRHPSPAIYIFADGEETEREPPQSPTHSRFEELPEYIVVLLVHFLLGSDVLRLASCNRHLRKALSDDCVWSNRLWTESTIRASSSAKDLYAQARSLFFRGDIAKTDRVLSDSVQMPLALFPKHRDISFDVWFALVPPADPSVERTGGILVAAQDVKAPLMASGRSRHRSRTATPLQWEVFAFVDEQRNLYCSVLSQRPVVAERLQCNRWYHLALTYDHKQHTQRVFLDGHLVNSQDGAARWPWLQFAQLGSGFVAGAAGGGWMGFRGLVDEFRVCYLPWTEAQVQQLAHGKRTNAPMAYALSRDLCRCDHRGQRLEVSCTRPAERHVEIMGPFISTPREFACRGIHGCGPRPKKKDTIWKLLRQCL